MVGPKGGGAAPREIDRIEWWRQLRERGIQDPTWRAVLLALSTWMDSSGASCFPAQAQIAKAAAVSEATVQRQLRRAVAAGWLEAWRVNVPGTRRSSLHYRATVPDEGYMSLQEQPRQPAGLLTRGARGRFNRTTPLAGPNNPAGQSVTTPPASGGSTHVVSIGPSPDGLQGISGEPIDEVVVRAKVLRLHREGFDSPTICALLQRYEISERLVRDLIASS